MRSEEKRSPEAVVRETRRKFSPDEKIQAALKDLEGLPKVE